MVYDSYVADKLLTELKPVEALALINRYAKLKDFYYDDVDRLYALKERKISEWVRTGEMIPKSVISRPSPVIEAMKTELANGGSNLDSLGYLDTPEDWHLTDEEEQNYNTLVEFCDNYDFGGYEVSFPEDIVFARKNEYREKLEAYLAAKEIYDQEMKLRQPIIEAYSKSCQEWSTSRQKSAQEWALENKICIARSNSGKSLKKDWVERLEKQGFKYEEPKPINPCGNLPKIAAPRKPDEPDLTYRVNKENYIPGSIPEIEKAILWAKSVLEKELDYRNLDDDFLNFELNLAMRDIQLENFQELALEIFQLVINKELTEPVEIYNRLTELPLDYEQAIGMTNYRDRWTGSYLHKDFGIWHEINLSQTGYWLVEFQSTVNQSITFHIPYDKCRRFSFLNIAYNNLPIVESDQETYGREISEQEQEDYPLTSLLQIFDLTVSDFPYQLQKYRKPSSTYYSYRDWEDEDCEDEDDEDWENDHF